MLHLHLLALTALAGLQPVSAGLGESPREYFRRAGYIDCPDSCELTGSKSTNWTSFSNVDTFISCKRKPKLFELAVHNPVANQKTNTIIRSCSSVADEGVTAQEADVALSGVTGKSEGISDEARMFVQDYSCGSSTVIQAIQEPQFGWTGSMSTKRSPVRGQIIGATRAIQSQLLKGESSCAPVETALFAHYGHTTVGLYSGARLQNQGAAATLVQKFLDHVHKKGTAEIMALQLCGGKNRTSEFVFGLIADATPGIEGLANVQRAVASWSNATCADEFDKTESFGNVTLSMIFDLPSSYSEEVSAEKRDHALEVRQPGQALVPRAECKTTVVAPGDGCWALAERCGITQANLEKYNGGGNFCSTLVPYQVVCCSSGTLPETGPQPNPDGTCATEQVISGDSCGTLASRCGITPAKFTEYNPDKNLCSTLAVGQYVCCSKGELPDMRPKPNPDGSCATYTVIEGDWCAKIASSYGLTVEELENFNKGVWGFTGCENLAVGAVLCLSKGDPPMPAPIPNAVCGPQKPGTTKPKDTSRGSLAKLNPCPLNVCCNIWGQCGTTGAFCEITGDGTPGDVKPGTNGCISNCGTEIVNNDKGPAQFRSIGYFEAWNGNRPCLYMDVEDLDTSKYTHVHFSFIDLTTSYEVSTANVQEQWDKFVMMKDSGITRVAAFGGWTASTHPSTYYLFRDGVKPENRETLASNLAAFINKYDLEGIDIDWEYPAAPDIPGIPPADPINGEHYRDFLALLRKKLPNKSISVAAPASYWYLRGFPIDEIAEICDYIVFMTYDLHGHWDYGSAWSQEGCPTGDCLRSHVNMTETNNALVMVTKAGVPTHKVAVGISSYGRSFKAAKAGCDGPMCRYLDDGGESAAAPGRCTETRGYVSDAEINDIMVNNKGARWFKTDDGSESDILVYSDHEWVGFMNEANKIRRTGLYQSQKFGGTSDWAVDLQRFSRKEVDGPIALPIEEGAWQAVPCSSPAINDTNVDPKKRWEGIRADDAWEEIKTKWQKRPSNEKDMPFTKWVSNKWHGRESMDCSLLRVDSQCLTQYQCHGFENKDDTGPAAYFILNSFVNLHGWMYSNYRAIVDASQNIKGDAHSFAAAFGHKDRKDENFLIAMILNVLTIGFTGGLAFFFNGALKNTIKETVRDNLKDISYVSVAVGAGAAKEIKSYVDPEDYDLESYVERAIRMTADGLETAMVNFTNKIFNGDSTSLNFLDKTLADGKLLGTIAPSLDDREIRKRWEHVIFFGLVSQAWDMEGITPVIIDTGADCDAQGVGVGDYISSTLAEYARGCVDDKLYYLVDPDGYPQWTDGAGHWIPNQFSEPNGLATIHQGDWSGVTVQGIIESAVRWTQKHGNRKSEDDGRPETVEEEFEPIWEYISNVHKDTKYPVFPGAIDIPVCDADEAWNGWFGHHGDKTPRYYTYPCKKL